MDAHDLHAVRSASLRVGRGSELLFALHQPVDIAVEVGERLVAVGREFPRIDAHQVEVARRRLSAVDRRGDGDDRRPLIERFEQIVHGADRRKIAQPAQLRQEAVAPPARRAVVLTAEIQTAVQRRALSGKTQHRKIVGREAEQRTEQHRKQRDVVGRIVDHAQQIEHQPYLLRTEEVAALLAIRGNPVLRELTDKLRAALLLALVLIGSAALGAHQHREVAERDRTLVISFGHGHARVDHLPNAARRIARLQSGFGTAFVKVALFDQGKLGIARGIERVALRAEVEILLGRVVGHDARKDEVDRVADLLTAAEVLAEIDHRGILRIVLVIGLIAAPALREQLRLGLTEAVDALLDVADRKEIFAAVGDAVVYDLLNQVHVLILVDDHLRESRGQLLCERRLTVRKAACHKLRFAPFAALREQPHRKQADVRKGLDAAPVLERAKLPVIRADGLAEGDHHAAEVFDLVLRTEESDNGLPHAVAAENHLVDLSLDAVRVLCRQRGIRLISPAEQLIREDAERFVVLPRRFLQPLQIQ